MIWAAALALAAVSGVTPMLHAGALRVDVEPSDVIDITLETSTAEVVLGEDLDLRVTIENTGSSSVEGLVVHIDITDPSTDGSVDPEDWTSTLTKPTDAIGPGQATTVGWTIQPIAAGTFSVYAVAIVEGATSLAASNIAKVVVTEQRSLNPGGILPVAIGAPVFVGALLVLQLRRSRAGGRGPEPIGDD